MSEVKLRIKVFLCHSSQDKPVVSELYIRLLAKDWLDPWLDKEKLLPGQDFDTEIEKAIESADAVIAFISKNAVNKTGYIQKELKLIYNAAMYKPEGQIFAIPLRLEECTPPHSLKLWHWVDYFGAEKEKTYESLLKSLKIIYEQVKAREKEDRENAEQETGAKAKLEAEELARQKEEKEAAEKAQLEAEELARQEIAQKSVREKIVGVFVEKIAREKAEKEAVEKAAREKLEREAAEKAAREKAEKAQLEAEELARQEIAQKSVREKIVGVLVEKIAREKAEKEAAEKAAREKLEREAAEKAAREKAEKEAVETARLKAEEEERQRIAKEKAEREAAEKAAREKAEKEEKEVAEKALLYAQALARQKAIKEKLEHEAADREKANKRKLFFLRLPVIWLGIVFLTGTIYAITSLMSPTKTWHVTPTVSWLPPVPTTDISKILDAIPTEYTTPIPTLSIRFLRYYSYILELPGFNGFLTQYGTVVILCAGCDQNLDEFSFRIYKSSVELDIDSDAWEYINTITGDSFSADPGFWYKAELQDDPNSDKSYIGPGKIKCCGD